jgi:hypothetical protein
MRIGVAGAGLIGRKHIELIEACQDCVLAEIADPSSDAKAFAEARTIPWYLDYRTLLDEAKPDGLIVASPNAMHLAMARDCVERGVPALVEKPVTDTMSRHSGCAWRCNAAACRCWSAIIGATIRRSGRRARRLPLAASVNSLPWPASGFSKSPTTISTSPGGASKAGSSPHQPYPRRRQPALHLR